MLEGLVSRWRVAKSLEHLRTQVNNAFPNRSKASDGTIGDISHQGRESDHNPWVVDAGIGVVTALDVTHDPAHGCDAGKLVYVFADFLGAHGAVTLTAATHAGTTDVVSAEATHVGSAKASHVPPSKAAHVAAAKAATVSAAATASGLRTRGKAAGEQRSC